jgi:hypothetical protein
VRAYGRIGRVEGALAQAADSVFNRLSPDEQRRAEGLFVRLVRPGEAGGATRRVARLEEFDAATRALAEKLSQREQWRLLTMHEDTVEIAHEQLATQWLRYQHWIANLSGDPEHGIPADPRGDDLRLLQSLIADAARWEAAPADDKARYHATGVDLELYRQLAGRRDAWLSEVERRFAAASADADQREKKRRKDERDERERLLRERQAQNDRTSTFTTSPGTSRPIDPPPVYSPGPTRRQCHRIRCDRVRGRRQVIGAAQTSRARGQPSRSALQFGASDAKGAVGEH